MKMKKFFSGILAAVMSIATIAMPLSTAIAAEDNTDPAEDKCIITINHAASTGTYTAYPIFTGNVEMELDDEGKSTGRMLIDDPKFHANLETKVNSSDVVARGDGNYGLWYYIKMSNTKVNNATFIEMMKAYDPNASISSFGLSINNASAVSAQAEALANVLNLTSSDAAVSNIISGNYGSAFYSAFAEAARMFMVDKITSGDTKALTGTAVGIRAEGSESVTIEVPQSGYYLVEYTPADYSANVDEEENNNYEKTMRAVRRSLVLVGKGTELSATINSKDTQNIATVDVQFNETLLKINDENNYVYNGDEGKWAKNVSAGNGDYVNCRVVVTLPGNFADYDQYYLAVPIMYGYNAGNSAFDHDKSITRQTGENKTENVKVYFLDDEKKIDINNAGLAVNNSYTYANNSGANTGDYKVAQDYFIAAETFVFTDIANVTVGEENKLAKNSGYNKLVIEFPVKFDRFSSDSALPTGAKDNLGFNGTSANFSSWVGDDALLKNYITVKAVYSNNPNLKSLAEEVNEDELSNSEKFYLDTTKAVGTLHNPVGVSKEASANIVTYRLRVHATTDDLMKISQAGGVEGVRFVLYDNTNKKYAEVKTLGSGTETYDAVSGEILRENKIANTTYEGKTIVYKIAGWADDYLTGDDEENKTVSDNCVLKTYSTEAKNGIYSNNHIARFEIVGLAPGDYSMIVLDETIKTADTYQSSVTTANSKDYALPKEGNAPKTEYRFSFAPTLSDTCTKLSYNTHYAPIDTNGNWDTAGSFTEAKSLHSTYFNNPSNNNSNSIITTADKLITDFNMKWYDMEGTEITKEKADWWLGQREDVALMSMRVTYIKKGLTLPVTGGIGTLIFFAVGGALVVLSTVAIVTKFRMKREQL